jgi:regulator of replication initiation timing
MDYRDVIDRMSRRTGDALAALSEAEAVISALSKENAALKSRNEQLTLELERAKTELKTHQDVPRGIYAGS